MDEIHRIRKEMGLSLIEYFKIFLTSLRTVCVHLTHMKVLCLSVIGKKICCLSYQSLKLKQ